MPYYKALYTTVHISETIQNISPLLFFFINISMALFFHSLLCLSVNVPGHLRLKSHITAQRALQSTVLQKWPPGGVCACVSEHPQRCHTNLPIYIHTYSHSLSLFYFKSPKVSLLSLLLCAAHTGGRNHKKGPQKSHSSVYGDVIWMGCTSSVA